MSILQSIVLGAVQGITEFLPISSSGHLLLAQEFLDIPKSFTFDVLLNFGTLMALLIFFRERIISIIKSAIYHKNFRYITYVIIASIPTLLIGYLGSDIIERLGTYTWLIVLMLTTLGTAMVIWGGKHGSRSLSRRDTIFMGVMQVLALIPGTSRSGITILTGLIRGANIKAVIEFSFMLAIPTISAAIVHTLFFNGGTTYIKDNLTTVLIGNFTSFILGALAIKTLLKILNKKGLAVFGWYRIALGCLIPVVLLIRLI